MPRTKPYSPSEAAPVVVAFIPEPPRFPKAARLPTLFFLVSMPVSKASPRVIETTGEPIGEWKAAS